MAASGMVATSQPLASLAALRILQEGGNAADAAVAAAAALNVTEPMSTGIGGDLFAIIYLAKENATIGINASGWSGSSASLDECKRILGAGDHTAIPVRHGLSVTVPGTVEGWSKIVERCGRMPLNRLLQPAIALAEEGFPIAPGSAMFWQAYAAVLAECPDSAKTWLVGGTRAPKAGELFRNPNLAGTLRLLAEGGSEAFYKGPIAREIVDFCQSRGGALTTSDFADYRSFWVEPISFDYRGYQVLELPPNGQGLVTLETLAILEGYDLSGMRHNSADAVHLQLEAAKLAIHDARQYVTDPSLRSRTEDLLSGTYIKKQRARITMETAQPDPAPGSFTDGDTVYVCVADKDGNVASLINSIFIPWGSGLTVGETGILLQNRGCGFSLDPEHINVIAPRKRTRHTILPAMVMKDAKPLIAFGCVGGDMQPQGQVQFLCNTIDFGMNLQDAIDAPRWRYEGTANQVALEQTFPEDAAKELERRGHSITGSGGFFGGAQAILLHPEYGTFQGGSDPRRDGCSIGY